MRNSVMRDSRFLRMWGASTASGLATWAVPFVLGLGVAQGVWAATALGILLGVRSAGFVVALPLAGVVADRLPRATVVRAAALLAAVATGLLVVALTTSTLLLGIPAAALLGVGQAACRPSFQAMVREAVDESRRQAANAAMTVSVRATTLLGPALTAVASRWLPLSTLLLATALLWVATALLPAPARPGDRSTPRAAGPHGSRPRIDPRTVVRQVVSDLATALAEARRHPWFVAGLGALLVIIALGYSATSVALPIVARERLGGDGALAAAVTAYTVGALGGGIVMARWTPANIGWWAFAGLACYGLVPLALALAPSTGLIIAVYVLAGVGIELFNVPWFTAVQREVPADRIARVSSLDLLVSYGLAPVGLALLAPALEQWGTTPVLVASGVACLLACAVAALVPSVRGLRVVGPRTPSVIRNGAA